MPCNSCFCSICILRYASHHPVELLLQLLQLLAHAYQRSQYVRALVYARAVLVEHLARCREFEAAHLHKVVYNANLLDVLLRILAHVLSHGLGFQMRKFRLPKTQSALTYVEHRRHLLDGVVQLHVLIGIQCHIICNLFAKVTKTKYLCKRFRKKLKNKRQYCII